MAALYVALSPGANRPFSITGGFKAGYGQPKLPFRWLTVIFTTVTTWWQWLWGLRVVVTTYKAWLVSTGHKLGGLVSRNTVVYSWRIDATGEVIAAEEAGWMISGSANPKSAKDVSDEEFLRWLIDLAGHIAAATRQNRVYVQFAGQNLIVQRQELGDDHRQLGVKTS
jgi:hypothetical protein